MAALYQQVTGKSTIPAGLGIIGAGVVRLSLIQSNPRLPRSNHPCSSLLPCSC